MSDSRWRKIANEVIAQVSKDNPGLPEHDLRGKISEAYPFGQRKYHPYKIWLSAVNAYFEPRARNHRTKIAPTSEGQLPFEMKVTDHE